MAGMASMTVVAVLAADYKVDGQYVTVPIEKVKAGGARVVRLQVVSDNIIRVQATSEAQLPKKQSLMIVKQTAKPKFTVSEDDDVVTIKAASVTAKVDEASGRVEFFDKDGKSLLKEAEEGKTFKPFRVPDREIGVDVAKVPEAQRNGLTWHLLFASHSNPREERTTTSSSAAVLPLRPNIESASIGEPSLFFWRKAIVASVVHFGVLRK